MKKYLVVPVLLMSILVLSGCSADQVDQEKEHSYIPPSETMTSYTIPDHEVNFEYPDNWTIEESGEDTDEYDLFSVATPNGNSMNVKYYPEGTEFDLEQERVYFTTWFYSKYKSQKESYQSNDRDIDFQGESLVYFPEDKGLVFCDDKKKGDYMITYPTSDAEENEDFRTYAENFCTQVYKNAWYHKLDTSDWKTYTNEEYGFSMKIPQDDFPRERMEEVLGGEKIKVEFINQSVMDATEDRGYLAYSLSVYEGEYGNFEDFLDETNSYKEKLELSNNTSVNGYEIWRTKPGKDNGTEFYIFSSKKVYLVNGLAYGGVDEIAWTVNSVVDTFTVLQ